MNPASTRWLTPRERALAWRGSGSERGFLAARRSRAPVAPGCVCPICFVERLVDPETLVDKAELKGATPLMKFAGDAVATFTN